MTELHALLSRTSGHEQAGFAEKCQFTAFSTTGRAIFTGRHREKSCSLQAAFSLLLIVGALGVAIVWIAAFSLLREPMRHKLSAIMIAGAGAAYLSGGLGEWELAACATFTAVAYKGLRRLPLHRPGMGDAHMLGSCAPFSWPPDSAVCSRLFSRLCRMRPAARRLVLYRGEDDLSSVLRGCRTTSRRRCGFEAAAPDARLVSITMGKTYQEERILTEGVDLLSRSGFSGVTLGVLAEQTGLVEERPVRSFRIERGRTSRVVGGNDPYRLCKLRTACHETRGWTRPPPRRRPWLAWLD